jgi:aminoglycoside N3'-acetyltransferase
MNRILRMVLGIEDLRQHFQAAGLSGASVCIHASIKSLGPLTHGPETVIQSALLEEMTVLVPTQSWKHFSAPKPTDRAYIELNAENDGSIPLEMPKNQGFSTDSIVVGSAMGILPRILLEKFPKVRGNHPLASFSATGPRAEFLISTQTADKPFAPIEQLIADKGKILLLGTDLTSMTALHYAEQCAGLSMLIRWALLSNGSVQECVVSGCSLGFEKLSDLLRPIESTYVCGTSHWRIFDAKELVSTATKIFREAQLIGSCNTHMCVRCETRNKSGEPTSDTR